MARRYRYYVSQTILNHGAGTCPVVRGPAAEIEAAVVDQLRAVFPPTGDHHRHLEGRKDYPAIAEADARAALLQFDPLWDELFPAEQARIVVGRAG